MPDLSHLSDADLKAEMDRRASGPQSPPDPLPNPDWAPLVECITGGVARSVSEGYEDEDFRHYVYEAAMTAVYGPEYWAWRRGRGW